MINHVGTREIKTERLFLRRFTENDLDDYFVWTGSAEMSRFIMEKPYINKNEAKKALLKITESYQSMDYYMWGIVFENELIGFCCGNEINEDIDCICIGYGIKKQYWNRGITTEAVKALIDYFFTAGFNRIFAYHNPLNPASGKVMLKSGMTFEGRIRGGSKLAGKICDCLQYSILKEDWLKNKECSSNKVSHQ